MSSITKQSSVMPLPRLALAAVSLVLVVAIAITSAGCGSRAAGGDVSASEGATLAVTRDFGATELREPAVLPADGDLSAMRQLQASAEVETSFGGRYVTAIDGVKQDTAKGYEWLFYVDGVESDTGATSVGLSAGQQVQWDYHRWAGVKTGGAIVGAFPEPLKQHGVALECIPNITTACAIVRSRMREARVRFNRKGVALKVGTWSELERRDLGIDLSSDPAGNGAFAAFPGDRTMQLAGDDGNVVRTLGASSGLIAAFAKGGEPLWIVTGVDTLGVEAAARGLEAKTLTHRFTVAFGDSGVTGLPVVIGGTTGTAGRGATAGEAGGTAKAAGGGATAGEAGGTTKGTAE